MFYLIEVNTELKIFRYKGNNKTPYQLFYIQKFNLTKTNKCIFFSSLLYFVRPFACSFLVSNNHVKNQEQNLIGRVQKIAMENQQA